MSFSKFIHVDEAVQVLSPEELQTDFESKQKQIFEAAVANSTKVATLLALAASFDASGSASSDADINLKSKRKRSQTQADHKFSLKGQKIATGSESSCEISEW